MQSQDLDKAFEALKTYDWGTDRKQMDPIDEAVIATRGDAEARKALEKRLAAVLGSGVSRSAKDYVCRTLKTMGTAESVPALAALLPDKDLSHMARYALERIPAPEAADALRNALPGLSAKLKAGVAGSLGVRRDEASVPALAGLLGDADAAVVSAAACALGSIGTPEAANVLGPAAKHVPQCVKSALADGCLVCAEQLLAAGKKAEAVALYKSLVNDQRKQVSLAAKRGLLSAAGKKD
jgi:HEAT repeat protein